MSVDPFDMTGQWVGVFGYPIDVPDIAFQANLVDDNGQIAGEVNETERGELLSARLSGARSGSTVTFLKLYDIADEEYDDVSYEGTLSSDGQQLSGTWSIPDHWSGEFVMTRNNRSAKLVSIEVTEKI